MIVPSRTDPRRGMHTLLYTCRCVDFGSTNTSFFKGRFMVCAPREPGVDEPKDCVTLPPPLSRCQRNRGQEERDSAGLRERSPGLRGAGLALVVFLQEALHLVHELRDVLELAVDGREADVGHLVEPLQVLHDQLAQLQARNLLLGPVAEPR